MTRQLSNQKKAGGVVSGPNLTKEDQACERWNEHFEEVLNIRGENIDIPEGCNIGENPDIETIDTSQIPIDEVERCNTIEIKVRLQIQNSLFQFTKV